MASEFDLIDQFFLRRAARPDVILGIGDDAAVLRPPVDCDLVLTVDTLVENVHFPAATDPESIGHKAAAVNLSDLAAMGAEPTWLTLALTLPSVDKAWLAAFSKGFLRLADQFGTALVGGDTTRGPLSMTVQAAGLVPRGQAITRTGALAGDGVFVTGEIGDAGLALTLLTSGKPIPPYCLQRLNRPTPRVEAGLVLRGIASAAIDVSDGLVADLKHILAGSGTGAVLDATAAPVSDEVRASLVSPADWRQPLVAGDDYELLFTVPAEKEPLLREQFCGLTASVTRIGQVVEKPGLLVKAGDDETLLFDEEGYDHFR